MAGGGRVEHDEVGVSLGPVVVNGLYPELAGLATDPVEAARTVGAALRTGEADALAHAAAFRRRRMELQTQQVARLADILPLPQLALPFLFDADLGPADVDLLATDLLAGIGGLATPPSGADG